MVSIKIIYMSYQNIIQNGNYFFPAWKHYGNPQLNVTCDRCNKTNLQACIGYGDRDLCLLCADNLTSFNIKPIIFPIPPNPFFPHPPFGKPPSDLRKF